MSTNIGNSALRSFILSKIGYDTLDRREAKELKISDDVFDKADADTNDELDVDEILDNEDTYELFATMYTEEKEQKTTKDEEEDKRRPVEGSGSNKGA